MQFESQNIPCLCALTPNTWSCKQHGQSLKRFRHHGAEAQGWVRKNGPVGQKVRLRVEDDAAESKLLRRAVHLPPQKLKRVPPRSASLIIPLNLPAAGCTFLELTA